VRSAEEPLPLTFEVRPGRDVVRQGEPYPGAWVVRAGRLLMHVVDPDGRKLTLDVLGQGDLVGGPPGWIAEASVRAMVHTWLAPAGSAELRDGLARRAHRSSALACALAWGRVAERVAGRLDDLAERFGRPVPGGRSVRLSLTQDDLADLAGSTRESVNRALADLARRGRITARRGTYVVGSGIDARQVGAGVVTPRPAGSRASTSCSNGRDR
jgi:CRP/FNR family transcriptional regulator, cyclic AMP receptor protein